MPHSVKLTWASSYYRYGEHDGIRVRITADCGNNVSEKIFAYRMLPTSLHGTEGHYSHVCSPVDLADYPADEPLSGASPEWFRLSYVDVLVRSVEEAENFVTIVREDVRRLIHTLDTTETLFDGDFELVGDNAVDCDASSSSSSSASLSESASVSYGSLQSLTDTGEAELYSGVGISWETIGTGAGSPYGASDSEGANLSQVSLCAGESSKLLLVHNYDFSAIPDDAIITGFRSTLVLRDATDGDVPSSMSSLSLSSSSAVAAECPRIGFLSLLHPEVGIGDTRDADACISGPSWEIRTYGDSTDMWGLPPLTGKDIKDGGFGFVIGVYCPWNTNNAIVEVDGVGITVFYREEL